VLNSFNSVFWFWGVAFGNANTIKHKVKELKKAQRFTEFFCIELRSLAPSAGGRGVLELCGDAYKC